MANLRNLRLDKSKYNTLTKRFSGDILVFQFYYPADIENNSPKLRGYAMKRGHKKVRKRAFEDLDYHPGFANPVIPEIRIQGDLQIIVDDLEELKDDSNSHPEIYDYFIFQPSMDSGHVVYKVSIFPTTKIVAPPPLSANPSPPASAE